MADNLSLFSEDSSPYSSKQKPLAERLRPNEWNDYQGLSQFDSNLIKQLQLGSGNPPSLILWGPPGSGKTTIAKLIGKTFSLPFVEFSAVLGGVKEVREIVSAAKLKPQATLLFVDEIHRFNKSQQDAFLPHVENGTIVLIGATTENPSFYLTAPLLSRMQVMKLDFHTDKSLNSILERALVELNVAADHAGKDLLIQAAGGDARRMLNMLENFVSTLKDSSKQISTEDLESFLKSSEAYVYDRAGDQHYDMVSAFIKSMRGSDPDAALYWGLRMIESGDDPRFVIRRMIIFASEDIGNADPRALPLAVSTWEAYDKLGLPEGRIPIAHCITYLASAPKSNRSYMAMHKALDAIKVNPHAPVPMHLRNAPTKLLKDSGHGKGYQYPHDTTEGYVAGVQYLPDSHKNSKFYEPSEHGFEIRIKERLGRLLDTDK
jgi:putative ATPase